MKRREFLKRAGQSLAALAVSGAWSQGAAQAATWDDPLVGEIALFPYNFVPNGWAECKGQLLMIDEYNRLFGVIGTTFGGDGETTFALPDMRATDVDDVSRNYHHGLEFTPLRYCISLFGVTPIPS